MKTEIQIQVLALNDEKLIATIAQWYFEEWSIPIERTTQRLRTQSPEDILFQLVLYKGDKPIATGGLYINVGIIHEHDKFKKLGPWIALLYTEPSSRNQKFGQILLQEIEKVSKRNGFNKIYLFTFTAESLYLRQGWKAIERVVYRGYDTVVMEKEIQ